MGSQRSGRLIWKRVGLGFLGILFFVLGLELMKEGTGGLAPLLRDHLKVTNTINSLGVGWLMAYLILSGSPVAAAAMALLSADALSSSQAFTMVAGSRLGASSVVLLIGFIYALRGHEHRIALTPGVLSLLLTGSIQLLSLPMGLLMLDHDWLERLSLPALASLAAGVNRGLDPLIGSLVAFLPSWMLFVIGVGLAILSFRLFDQVIPQVHLEKTDFEQIPRLVYRPEVMFLIGLTITLVTMSVSTSVSILVPLSTRGYVRRENIIPYILGANISTMVDTLIAAALLGDPRAVTVIVIYAVCTTLASLLIILLAYSLYEQIILAALTRITRRQRNFTLFMGMIIVVPVLLILS
jgi:sodium-dependent phosphate cotransporter